MAVILLLRLRNDCRQRLTGLLLERVRLLLKLDQVAEDVRLLANLRSSNHHSVKFVTVLNSCCGLLLRVEERICANIFGGQKALLGGSQAHKTLSRCSVGECAHLRAGALGWHAVSDQDLNWHGHRALLWVVRPRFMLKKIVSVHLKVVFEFSVKLKVLNA